MKRFSRPKMPKMPKMPKPKLGGMRPKFSRGRSTKGAEEQASIVHAPDTPLMRAINLLPQDRRPETRRITWKPAHMALAVLVPLAALGIGALYLNESQAAEDAKADQVAAEAEVSQLQAQVLEAGAGRALDLAATAQLPEVQGAISGGLAERISWDRVLDSVDRMRLPDMWFTSITGANLADSSTTGSPGEFRIDGAFRPGNDHDKVAEFAARLERLREFESVRIETSNYIEIAGTEPLAFSITADVRGPQ